MEGVTAVRKPLPRPRPCRPASLMAFHSVRLGPAGLHHRVLHRSPAPRPPRPADHHLGWPGLRRHPLLRHQPVRRVVLPAGGVLLLVLLLLLQLYLDGRRLL